MPIPEPLCLSDAQITTVMSLARPLQPAQRTAFLEMLAAKLNGQRELGDGAISRATARAILAADRRGWQKVSLIKNVPPQKSDLAAGWAHDAKLDSEFALPRARFIVLRPVRFPSATAVLWGRVC